MTTREQIISLVGEYDRILETLEREPHSVFAQGALTRFLREYPGIPDYDNRGNYIGRVQYEDGWTA